MNLQGKLKKGDLVLAEYKPDHPEVFVVDYVWAASTSPTFVELLTLEGYVAGRCVVDHLTSLDDVWWKQ